MQSVARSMQSVARSMQSVARSMQSHRRPPPRSTSAVRSVACWSAIECCKSRWRTCELNAAGVASVSEDVTTSPVLMPFALAASIKVAHGRSSGVTAIW